MIRFPSALSQALSPDGHFAVVNVDSEVNPHHTLFLENRRTKERRKLMDYDRHVEILWNPKSEFFAVTNFAGSNVAECLVFAVAGGEPVNVVDQMEKGVNDARELSMLRNNDHVYLEAVRWVNAQSLRVKVWGHGDANPAGFTRFYTFHLARAK